MENRMIFKDKRNTRLRMLQVVIGLFALLFFIFVAGIEDAGYMAIFILFVPLALMVDGFLRWRVLKEGIIIDKERMSFSYPKLYSRKTLNLLDVNDIHTSKSVHSGANFGVTVYSYDIVLQGSFGTEVLVFATKEEQKRVLQAINDLHKVQR